MHVNIVVVMTNLPYLPSRPSHQHHSINKQVITHSHNILNTGHNATLYIYIYHRHKESVEEYVVV